MKRLMTLVLCFLLSQAHAETMLSAELRAATLEHGRVLAVNFFAGVLDPIWNASNDEGRAQFGNLEGLKSYRAEQNALGAEVKLLKEEVLLEGDTVYYARTVRLERASGDYQLWIGFDEAGKVSKLVMKPASDQGDAPSGTRG